ncbi:MAG: hypothetical protein GY830_00340 [Bacteroidetes bacterium]|nr:hypothetical protein [Bacteroidota bacterium]
MFNRKNILVNCFCLVSSFLFVLCNNDNNTKGDNNEVTVAQLEEEKEALDLKIKNYENLKTEEKEKIKKEYLELFFKFMEKKKQMILDTMDDSKQMLRDKKPYDEIRKDLDNNLSGLKEIHKIGGSFFGVMKITLHIEENKIKKTKESLDSKMEPIINQYLLDAKKLVEANYNESDKSKIYNLLNLNNQSN